MEASDKASTADKDIPKISRNEAARRLGVSYYTIRNMGEQKLIREFRSPSGSMIRVSAEDVDNYLKQSNPRKKK